VKQQCNCRYILYIDMMVTGVCVMGKTEISSLEKIGSSYALYLTFIELHQILKFHGLLI